MCKVSHFSVTNQENPEKILLQSVIEDRKSCYRKIGEFIQSGIIGTSAILEYNNIMNLRKSFYRISDYMNMVTDDSRDRILESGNCDGDYTWAHDTLISFNEKNLSGLRSGLRFCYDMHC